MKNKNISLVKFTVVAIAIGFFSPSVSIQPEVQSGAGMSALPMHLHVSLLNTAEARRGGGGGARRGGGGARRGGGARSRPSRSTRSGNRSRSTNKSRNTNRNKNVNRNTNVNRNVNRNVNVNVNNRYYGGHGRGYGYYGGAPILAFTTGLVLGSVIAASTMPSTCTTVVTNGISYRRCDNSYYQPFYEGDTLVYKSVASPYY